MEGGQLVTSQRIQPRALGVLALILALPLMGCDRPPSRPPPASGQPVLIVAVTATRAESRPQLPQSVNDYLLEVARRSRTAGGASVALLVAGQSSARFNLTPMRGNRVEHTASRRETKARNNVEEFARAVAAAHASQAGLDLLGLLDHAGREYPRARIVALSSGVSTADPLDLRQLGWPDGDQWVVDDLKRRDALPQYLTGRGVTFFYLGDTAGRQPRLPIPVRKSLTRLYLAVCEAAGATRCDAQEDPPSGLPTTASPAVPVVAVPTVGTPQPGRLQCKQVTTLPAVLLFAPNTAVLAPDADTLLHPLADRVRNSRGLIAISEIAGHTAAFGPGDGRMLSQQRAQAVADRLVRLGVPRSAIKHVVGRGDTQPIVANRNPDRSPNPLATRNRRVEITTTTCTATTEQGGPS